ncbi:MAG: hypothetical protein AAFY88_09335 [Acidobacteriota bacterium]
MESPRSGGPPPWRDHLEGVGLFLFIPVVLYLFVAKPEPIGASLIAGVVLMVGHRRVARPYMRRVAPRICLWTHRRLGADEPEVSDFTLQTGAGPQDVRCLARHRDDIGRFFTFLRRFRPILALGIFAPLLFLLGTTAIVAFGARPLLPLDTATAIFQLSVGLTVNVAAYCYRLIRRIDPELRVGFPAHNFYLLGIRTLLWIFRIVGVVWIVRGVRYFL